MLLLLLGCYYSCIVTVNSAFRRGCQTAHHISSNQDPGMRPGSHKDTLFDLRTSSTFMSVLYCSMLTKLGRKKGQLSPRKPHLATWTGVLARSVVKTSSRSTPDTSHSLLEQGRLAIVRYCCNQLRFRFEVMHVLQQHDMLLKL